MGILKQSFNHRLKDSSIVAGQVCEPRCQLYNRYALLDKNSSLERVQGFLKIVEEHLGGTFEQNESYVDYIEPTINCTLLSVAIHSLALHEDKSNAQAIVTWLLEDKNANPNISSCLHIACAAPWKDLDSQLRCVQMLINHGADVNVETAINYGLFSQYFHGYRYWILNPLTLAIYSESIELIKLLVENGAQVCCTRPVSFPLFQAANVWYSSKSEKAFNVLKYLMQHGATAFPSNYEWTAKVLFGLGKSRIEFFNNLNNYVKGLDTLAKNALQNIGYAEPTELMQSLVFSVVLLFFYKIEPEVNLHWTAYELRGRAQEKVRVKWLVKPLNADMHYMIREQLIFDGLYESVLNQGFSTDPLCAEWVATLWARKAIFLSKEINRFLQNLKEECYQFDTEQPTQHTNRLGNIFS